MNPMGIPEAFNFQIPQFRNWKVLRGEVTTDDTDPTTITPIDLSNYGMSGAQGARFIDNRIFLMVKSEGEGAGAGTVVELWAKLEIGDSPEYYFVDSRTTTKALQTALFKDLPAMKYVVLLTSVTGTVTISGEASY